MALTLTSALCGASNTTASRSWTTIDEGMMRKHDKPAVGAPRAQRGRKTQGSKVPARAKPLRSDVQGLRPSPEPDPRALLHELQVHQIELELQNDELRTARGELELALSRYTELFDFAPIGYATVQADQTIQDINHAGCQLLVQPRSVLRGWRVEQLVPVAHQIGLRSLLLAAEASGVRESSVLELVRADGSSFPARVS